MTLRSLQPLALCAASLAALPTAQAQDCNTPPPFFLVSQADVDAFDCRVAPSSFQLRGTNITNLDGLSELTTINGSLLIDLPNLTNVDGLSGLTSVNALTITSNDRLENIDGLSSLSSFSALGISGNPVLTNVDGLSGVVSGGDISISSNPVLQNVDGLSGLTSARSVTLLANGSLANVDGLRNLASLGPVSLESFPLDVRSNAALVRCAVGLGPILAADRGPFGAINGNTRIESNDPAGDCNSEQSILAAYVPPVELPIVDATLSTPGGSLTLPFGRGQVRVTANATFTGETGQRFTIFLRLDGVEGAFTDGYSRLVKRGEIKPRPGQTVSQSIKFATIADDPFGPYTVSLLIAEGSVPLSAAGDAAVFATLPAFKTGLGGLRAAEGLSVFPNPAADAATLRFAVAEAGEATLVVYDALGRAVARPVDGWVEGAVTASFDASGLAPGLYVARLVTARGTETVRLTVAR